MKRGGSRKRGAARNARSARRGGAKRRPSAKRARASTSRRRSSKRAGTKGGQSRVARVKRVTREVVQQASDVMSAGVETLKGFGENMMDRVRSDTSNRGGDQGTS
jgi:hypothetical protein